MNHPHRVRTFPEQPDVLDLGDRQKELHSPYQCVWEQNGRSVRFVVPTGFVYNGASVPQALWSIYPPHALDRAAVFHDFIYRVAGKIPSGVHQYLDGEEWKDVGGYWTRPQADKFFYHQLTEDPKGPRRWRQWAAWASVRAFGGSRWG